MARKTASKSPGGRKSAAGKSGTKKKTALKKTASRASAPKAAAGKAAKKATAKKAAAKKPATKKAAAKKPATKKATAKKPATKKVAAKKPATKKAGAKKAAAKKAPPKKSAKKAPPKKASRGQANGQAAAQRSAEDIAGSAPVRVEEAQAPSQPTGYYGGIHLCDKVKPFPARNPYSRKEQDRMREALLAERHQLVSELASLYGVSRDVMEQARENPGYSLHMAEHATDLQTAEANQAVSSIAEERLRMVEDAIERIDRNLTTFGLCLACGSKIGIQRLIARPHAHLCSDCQGRYEKARARRGY